MLNICLHARRVASRTPNHTPPTHRPLAQMMAHSLLARGWGGLLRYHAHRPQSTRAHNNPPHTHAAQMMLHSLLARVWGGLLRYYAHRAQRRGRNEAARCHHARIIASAQLLT